MGRHLLIVVLLAALGICGVPAGAQVNVGNDPPPPHLDQFLPDSFTLDGQAVAQTNGGPFWTTYVNFQLKNNSGMNLYMGIEQRQLSFGSCSDVQRISGGLPGLPNPGATVYSAPAGSGPPRGIYMPAGAVTGGTIELAQCAAPNPGFPTAPLSFTLLLGNQAEFRRMVALPIRGDLPIRQITP